VAGIVARSLPWPVTISSVLKLKNALRSFKFGSMKAFSVSPTLLPIPPEVRDQGHEDFCYQISFALPLSLIIAAPRRVILPLLVSRLMAVTG